MELGENGNNEINRSHFGKFQEPNIRDIVAMESKLRKHEAGTTGEERIQSFSETGFK